MYAAAWQRANKRSTTPKKYAAETSGNPAQSTSPAEAAAKFNVSARGVSQAAVVIDHGCKQLQQAVRDGRVNVTLAERVARTSRTSLSNKCQFLYGRNRYGLVTKSLALTPLCESPNEVGRKLAGELIAAHSTAD